MMLCTYASRTELMTEVAQAVLHDMASALKDGDRLTLAVPGGTTPGPVFDIFAETDFDWDRVDIVLTDERWVPADHDRSNTKLLNERLLTDFAARANYISLYTGGSAKAEMPGISKALEPLLPLDVLLIGMGADMHCASLFPGMQELAEALSENAPPVMALTGGNATETRVSLTGRVLSAAAKKHILITGQEKRDALDAALSLDDPLAAPILTVLPTATVHWAE